MIRLDIGAGPHSDYEYQIDQVWFEKTTHVIDPVVEDLPFKNDFFDEVRASQFLEHVPVVIYYKEDGKFNKTYPRIHIMREVYRVLKPGGLFRISTPTEWPYWAQDPTHCDTPFLPDTVEYFCGGWGADNPNDFAQKAYGINFAFKWHKREQVGFNMDVILQKPS
mgnify:CR=1 FL=1